MASAVRQGAAQDGLPTPSLPPETPKDRATPLRQAFASRPASFRVNLPASRHIGRRSTRSSFHGSEWLRPFVRQGHPKAVPGGTLLWNLPMTDARLQPFGQEVLHALKVLLQSHLTNPSLRCDEPRKSGSMQQGDCGPAVCTRAAASSVTAANLDRTRGWHP